MSFTTDQILAIIGIVISAAIAICIYLLQRKLTDRQKLDYRLEIESNAGKKLREIQRKKSNSKIQLYNTRLIDSKRFASNKRSWWWGYPFRAAEFYAINFDGLEFIVGLEELDGVTHAKVGVIPFDRIIAIKPEGDGSFAGMIFYVKPRMLQIDKYAIAYKKYRYHRAEPDFDANSDLGR